MANIDYEEGKKYGLNEYEIATLLSASPEVIAHLIVEHPDSRTFIEKTFQANGMEFNLKEIINCIHDNLESPYNNPEHGLDYDKEKAEKLLEALNSLLERQGKDEIEDYPEGAELDIEPAPLDEMEQEATDKWVAFENNPQPEEYSTDELEEMLKQELARNEAKAKELEELQRKVLIQKIMQAQADGKKLDLEIAKFRAKVQDAR